MAWFGVGDAKGVVETMFVRSGHQVTMQGEDVIHEMEFKLLYVFFLGLASHEFFPSLEEIFWRNDIMVGGS